MVLAMTVQPRTAPPRTAPRRTSCFSSRLDAEWTQIRTARRCLLAARRWVADDPDHPLAVLVADATDLDVVIRATQRGVVPAGSDEVILHRLVELARHDELAGRLVIQRLLPGLISQAVAHRDFYETIDPIELVVPAAWLALRTFDTERRRHHIAASLISDAVFAAFRAPLRRKSASEEVRSPDRFDERRVRICSRHRRWRNSPASFVTPAAQVCRRATSSCCGAWPRWSRRAWWHASAT